MKRVLTVLSFIMILVITSGCEALSRMTDYSLANENIEFEMANSWIEEDNDSSDITLSKSSTKLSLVSKTKEELNGMSAQEYLNSSVKEKLSEMDDQHLLKKYPIINRSDRTIYSILYTASKDGIETQYYFNVLEFKGTDTYVYALYEAKETSMKYNIDDVQRMLLKMEWTNEKELAMY